MREDMEALTARFQTLAQRQREAERTKKEFQQQFRLRPFAPALPTINAPAAAPRATNASSAAKTSPQASPVATSPLGDFTVEVASDEDDEDERQVGNTSKPGDNAAPRAQAAMAPTPSPQAGARAVGTSPVPPTTPKPIPSPRPAPRVSAPAPAPVRRAVVATCRDERVRQLARALAEEYATREPLDPDSVFASLKRHLQRGVKSPTSPSSKGPTQ